MTGNAKILLVPPLSELTLCDIIEMNEWLHFYSYCAPVPTWRTLYSWTTLPSHYAPLYFIGWNKYFSFNATFFGLAAPHKQKIVTAGGWIFRALIIKWVFSAVWSLSLWLRGINGDLITWKFWPCVIWESNMIIFFIL